MPTHHLDFGLSTGNTVLNVRVSQTAGLELHLSETVPMTANNMLIGPLSLDRSRLKSLVLICDQPVLVKTNSSTTPDDTFTLPADIPLIWVEGMFHEQPLTEDVTALYVTSQGEAAGTLRLFALQDPTP